MKIQKETPTRHLAPPPTVGGVRHRDHERILLARIRLRTLNVRWAAPIDGAARTPGAHRDRGRSW